MKDLEQMLMKKKDSGKMSEDAVKAKQEVLEELMAMCEQALGHGVKSGMDEMKKVSVMAPDKKSLVEGLDKAKDLAQSPMLEKMEEMAHKDLDEDQEEEESQEHKEKLPEEEKPEMKVQEEDEDESPFNRKMKKMMK